MWPCSYSCIFRSHFLKTKLRTEAYDLNSFFLECFARQKRTLFSGLVFFPQTIFVHLHEQFCKQQRHCQVFIFFLDKQDKPPDGSVPILHRGRHEHQFEFKLPETALPCSFESKVGHIRYYLRVVMDIPYASPPQGIKYFTIVGPHIDCMDDRYLVSAILQIRF